MIHGSDAPITSVPGAVEVAFGLAVGAVVAARLAEVAVADAEVADRVVSGKGDDEEQPARPSASAHRQAVRHDGRRGARAVRSGRAGAPACVVVMTLPLAMT
jgi:hypothetical protein